MRSGIPTPQQGLQALSRALSQMGLAKKIQVCLILYLKYYCGKILASYFFSLWISQVIGKARIPIIKFVEKTSGIAFDIRFTFCIFCNRVSNE